MTEEPSPPADFAASDAARDLALMNRVRAGDTAAFQELVELHQHRVVGTIAKMLGGDADAEDVAQQVFIRVWRSAAKWEPTAKFTTWLFTITRNLVFNELRRRKRHPAQSMDAVEPGEKARDWEDAAGTSPDESVLKSEMQREIDAAIESLPEAQRLAIIMRRYNESPYEEIAAVLKMSVPAVKSVIFRARETLRQKLQKYLHE